MPPSLRPGSSTHNSRALLTTLPSLSFLQPCCQGSVREGKEKYYSIDKRFNHCGEACMKPEHYKFFKLFEPG